MIPSMSPARTIVLCVLLATGILCAGCTSGTPWAGSGSNDTQVAAQSMKGYHVTIAQPDAESGFIRMDSDVYNAGEVVEFVVRNDGLLPLECSRTPPDFRVVFQTGSGKWAAKMGGDTPAAGNASFLQNGESTKTYRFVSTGWEPGRYRIVSDCGPEREILVRVPATPVPTPTACPVNLSANKTPWIRIDPIPDQKMGQPFTIRGTTNLPADTVLRYTISPVATQKNPKPAPAGSFTTPVVAGTCGTNTWSAMGEIQVAGNFFIGIEDKDGRVTAIKRFSIEA